MNALILSYRIFIACFITSTLFIVLMTHLAFAYPAVGDRVEWQGEIINKDGQKQAVTFQKEVVAFNSKESLWSVKHTTLHGETPIESKTLEEKALYTPEKYQALMKACERKGGSIEEIEATTGKYRSCKIVSHKADGTVVETWWSDLPFGIVERKTHTPLGTVSSAFDLNEDPSSSLEL